MTARSAARLSGRIRNLAGRFERRRDLIEMIGGFSNMCRRLGADETILAQDETILRFWRITRETAHGYQLHNDERRHRRPRNLETKPCARSASSLRSVS